VIAIDGPVGAGKSTVARGVASRLGLDHLDTGAMYRGVTLTALRKGIAVEQASVDELIEVARSADVDPADPELRSTDVGRMVSLVAAIPEVRAVLVKRQREWVEQRGAGVVEGRDIGTVVLPDAQLKVFLTASDDERARRRNADESAADLARRDRLDSTRAVSPLVLAEGAIVIDSTDRPVDEIVEQIVSLL
jgi:cytidylate kinase